MALTIKLPLLIVTVLLFSTKMMISPAECSARLGWLDNKTAAPEFHHRQYQQMLYKLKSESMEVSKRGGGRHGNNDKYEDMVEWDLRKVPAGPDPLHHNGGGPKKPRTP